MTVKVGDKAPDFMLPSQMGDEVLGISEQSVESHVTVASHYGLPFILLADVDNKVRELYDAPKSMGIMPGRVTYIIDKKGVVRHIFNLQTMRSGTLRKQSRRWRQSKKISNTIGLRNA